MIKKYTKEEDEIIINQVKNYPTNLLHAFREASKLIDRAETAISFRYYHKLKKDPSIVALTVGSKKGFTQNVKNVPRDKEGNLPNQGLKHYMTIMKELLELPISEREAILKFFGTK